MKYDCVMVVVNCEENDKVDVNCGGPRFLGYDFFVPLDTNTDELETFIKDILVENHQPLMDMTFIETAAKPNKLWDKNMIKNCIERGY